MTNKVITNATIYTGKGVLENAFVRFDKQILEVGSMADFQADKAEEVIDAKGQNLFQVSLMFIPTVVIVLTQWMQIQKHLENK